MLTIDWKVTDCPNMSVWNLLASFCTQAALSLLFWLSGSQNTNAVSRAFQTIPGSCFSSLFPLSLEHPFLHNHCDSLWFYYLRSTGLGNLLEMQTLGPDFAFTESESVFHQDPGSSLYSHLTGLLVRFSREGYLYVFEEFLFLSR